MSGTGGVLCNMRCGNGRNFPKAMWSVALVLDEGVVSYEKGHGNEPAKKLSPDGSRHRQGIDR